jgi:hypothetical protein
MTDKGESGVETIESFEKTDDYGTLALRNGVAAAFFFDRPPERIAEQILAALDAFVTAVPAKELRYAVTSASAGQFKPFGPGTIAACRKQLNPAAVKKRELSAVLVGSEGKDAPRYRFEFTGQRSDKEMPLAGSVLDMAFPIESLASERIHAFVTFVAGLSELLDYSSGYCGPALLRKGTVLGSVDRKELRGFAVRHPGYDVADNKSSANLIGGLARGTHWITWLGPALTDRLGGEAALRQELGDSILVQASTKGLMIRAGEFPELGDVNRRRDTPLLRRLARGFEAVTLFDDQFSPMYQLFGDKEFLAEWERRFLRP